MKLYFSAINLHFIWCRTSFLSDFSLSQQQRLAICSQGDGVLLGFLPAGLLEQRMIYFKAHFKNLGKASDELKNIKIDL